MHSFSHFKKILRSSLIFKIFNITYHICSGRQIQTFTNLKFNNLIVDKLQNISVLFVLFFNILDIIFIMGSQCSTSPIRNSVGILGSGNSAVIINGMSYNISNMFNVAVKLVMQEYRSELILMQFTSVSLVVILILLVVWCFSPRSIVVKGEIIY
jgi:hypothetical protein